MLYADSANHIGLDPELLNAIREQWSLALNNQGLATHVMLETADHVESRGVWIERVGLE